MENISNAKPWTIIIFWVSIHGILGWFMGFVWTIMGTNWSCKELELRNNLGGRWSGSLKQLRMSFERNIMSRERAPVSSERREGVFSSLLISRFGLGLVYCTRVPFMIWPGFGFGLLYMNKKGKLLNVRICHIWLEKKLHG